ncbi:MAG: flagellar basal-body rod protein FlgF [Spirochaetia bacterium]
MVRGWYTGASGMNAQQHRMDQISNNLANVDTTGYKRDQSVHKAFPELLLRRMNDDGLRSLPLSGRDPVLGSFDTAPIVGRLGTGVEQNEVYTDFDQGTVRQTDNPLDLALDGEGFFLVETPQGERLTRNGTFHRSPEGLLVTKEGYPVLGENGYIEIQENNFDIDEDGRVTRNATLAEDSDRLVSQRENQWEESEEIDRIQLVDVDNPRYLEKQGSSLWASTWDSGEQQIIDAGERPQVLQGFLETANVNPVREMVEMIEVNRAYEANQRVIQTHDESTQQLLNTVLRAR